MTRKVTETLETGGPGLTKKERLMLSREKDKLEKALGGIKDMGGVPDLLAPVFGRVAAVVKATAEQVAPLDEALLSDLSLEHQLLDRARYIKVLAETAEEPRVLRLAERLITAHSATVEWLSTVLAEEALGGPAALRATAKGGTVVCAGIHMSDIPSFPYADLWGERQIRSVANLTRADGEEFLPVARQASVRAETTVFGLGEADHALAELRGSRVRGAAVLRP